MNDPHTTHHSLFTDTIMIEINITEYEGYDEEAFLEFLEGEEDEVKLMVPKKTALYQNSHLDIANEYMDMMLLGQRLCELADEFSYEISPMNRKGHYVFYVRQWDRVALAALLALLVAMQEGDIEKQEEFTSEAGDLLGMGDRMELACYDYYVLASHFLLIEDNEGTTD